MIELQLKSAPVIDRYDWEVLSCLDRTLATVAYTLHGQSFWQFVFNKYELSDGLRKYIDVKIGDANYYHTVCARAGVKLTFNRLTYGDAHQFILNGLERGEYPIVIINDKFRPLSKHYGVKNHGFFVLIYGYDDQKDEYLTYDLPLEKEFWRIEKSANGIVYERQRLSRRTLFSYCDREYLPAIGGLEDDVTVNTGRDVAVLVVGNVSPCEVVPAEALLKTELQAIIVDSKEHYKYVENLLNRFLIFFDKRYSGQFNISLSDVKRIEEHDTEGLKQLLFYPYELKLVCWHEAHIKMLVKTLPFLGIEAPELLNTLFRRHTTLKFILIRTIVRHDKKELESVVQKLLELIDGETQCYKEICDKL